MKDNLGVISSENEVINLAARAHHFLARAQTTGSMTHEERVRSGKEGRRRGEQEEEGRSGRCGNDSKMAWRKSSKAPQTAVMKSAITTPPVRDPLPALSTRILPSSSSCFRSLSPPALSLLSFLRPPPPFTLLSLSRLSFLSLFPSLVPLFYSNL